MRFALTGTKLCITRHQKTFTLGGIASFHILFQNGLSSLTEEFAVFVLLCSNIRIERDINRYADLTEYMPFFSALHAHISSFNLPSGIFQISFASASKKFSCKTYSFQAEPSEVRSL